MRFVFTWSLTSMRCFLRNAHEGVSIGTTYHIVMF